MALSTQSMEFNQKPLSDPAEIAFSDAQLTRIDSFYQMMSLGYLITGLLSAKPSPESLHDLQKPPKLKVSKIEPAPGQVGPQWPEWAER